MEQLNLFNNNQSKFVTIKDASIWASKQYNREISTSNITYLIQYARIKKHGTESQILVDIGELGEYFDSINKKTEYYIADPKYNPHLSFVEYKEYERTKHVHRLHPYKGKFIPQLVEYFLDGHTDEQKKKAFFQSGDLILDPFCGSGTTLVQANELGINALGIDISFFNCLISNVKVGSHDVTLCRQEIDRVTKKIEKVSRKNQNFDLTIADLLSDFNNRYFPTSIYKRWINEGKLVEEKYSQEKLMEFLKSYELAVADHQFITTNDLNTTFVNKWYLKSVIDEINIASDAIQNIKDDDVRNVLTIILSRTVRSCRATTHADLGTLIEPTLTPYYCRKHNKICRPIVTMLGWWKRYADDTINRIVQFSKLKTNTFQECIHGDSRTIDLVPYLKNSKINGVFTSPPYVGLIDYHEQHAYAYEIFDINRSDEFEIGPLFKGKGKQAISSYVSGISEVLVNTRKYLVDDFEIFLVANDKFNLYPKIAENADLEIVDRYHRPVLNRVEKDRNAYSETIFHMKRKA